MFPYLIETIVSVIILGVIAGIIIITQFPEIIEKINGKE